MSTEHKVHDLPEGLLRATATLASNVRKTAVARAVGTFAGCLLASWLTLFAFDRVWDVLSFVRIAVAVAGWTGAILALFAWHRGGVMLPRS